MIENVMIECALQEKGQNPKSLNRKRQFYCQAIGNSCECHGFIVIEVPFHSRCSICYEKCICVAVQPTKILILTKNTPKNNNIKTKQTKNQRKKGSKPDCTCFTYGLVYAMGCANDQYQKAQTPKASHSTAQAKSRHNKALLGKSVLCFKGFQNQMSHGNI